jgi:hypothetical protein
VILIYPRAEKPAVQNSSEGPTDVTLQFGPSFEMGGHGADGVKPRLNSVAGLNGEHLDE